MEATNLSELHFFYICKMELTLALLFFMGVLWKSPNTHLFLKLSCSLESPKNSQNYTFLDPFI